NKKILIITGSFGNGHMQVTQSIVNQLNDMNLDHLSVIEHDLFMEAHPILTSICKNICLVYLGGCNKTLCTYF
ncbi:hypothetical protein EX85_15350, partial [Staphylococcus aureus]